MLEDDESYVKYNTYYYSDMIGSFTNDDPLAIEVKEYSLMNFEIGFKFNW